MIIIDREFQKLIPPLIPEEKIQLEENLKTEGCRDPLVVWGDVLLDGHNRFEICNRLGIKFNTVSLDFSNRDAAADWIDKNQLGRRNLTPDQMSLLRGRRYNRAKKLPHGRSDRDFSGDQIDTPKTAERLAKEHGVSPATIKRDGKMAAFMDNHPDEAEAVIKGEKKLKDIKREIRDAEIQVVREKIESEPQELKGKYSVVVIDPPWPYGRKYDPETSRVANPYPEMPLDEISKIKLPIEDDAVVFLWTTHAFLRAAFDLLDTWNLKYKATLVWDKESMGMGSTVRMQCEFCLLATSGKPIIEGSSERDIIREKRREHSRKPDGFYSLVERMTIGRKLDYFSREQRDGWAVYGAEQNKF